MTPEITDGRQAAVAQHCVKERDGRLVKKLRHQREKRLEVDSQIDKEGERLGPGVAEVLLGENLHRTIEHKHVVDAGFLGALALVMDDARLGKIVVLVAALRDAIRQVDVLAVHEKSLVEQAHLIQGLAPHQHESAGQNLHFVDLIVGEMAHVIPCKTLAVREKLGQAKHLVKCRLRRG